MGIALVTTGMGADLIYTGAGRDFINAGNGNNRIFAGEGDNRILSGSGNDLVFAGGGNDTIYTGAGDDTIFAGNGNNIINAGTGNDTVTLGSGNDKLILEGGLGSVTVMGFDVQSDKLRLGESLLGKTLTFSQQGIDTIVMSGADLLATLRGVIGGSASLIDSGPLYRYKATDLGSLSSNANGSVVAGSINDFGQIAGRYDTGALFTNTSETGVVSATNIATKAFIWENGVQVALTSNGTKVGASDFGAANGAPVTMLTARANKINNMGMITGTHDEVRQPIPLSTDRGLRWDKDGASYTFTVNSSGGKETYFFDSNELGQIAGRNIKTVGIGTGTGTVNTPFSFENGVYTFLSVGSGVNGTAFGLNNSGTLVGVISGAADGTNTAAVWTKDSSGNYGNYQLQNLGTLGAAQASLRDINDMGSIIGTTNNGTGAIATSNPFILRNGVVTNLGSLGGKTGSVNGLNEFGDVVGASQLAPVGTAAAANNAYVWNEGVQANLNSLLSESISYNGAAVTLNSAVSINNFGEIVATGTYTYKDAAGKDATGTRSYILNAV